MSDRLSETTMRMLRKNGIPPLMAVMRAPAIDRIVESAEKEEPMKRLMSGQLGPGKWFEIMVEGELNARDVSRLGEMVQKQSLVLHAAPDPIGAERPPTVVPEDMGERPKLDALPLPSSGFVGDDPNHGAPTGHTKDISAEIEAERAADHAAADAADAEENLTHGL